MKNLKTSEILAIYSIVKTAKVSKVENSTDKYAIIKAIRPLKKVADSFEQYKSDAMERLKPADYDMMMAKLQEWQKQERNGNVTMTEQERAEINQFIIKFDKDIDGCMKSELEKQNEMEVAGISEESLMQFFASNDFNVVQMAVLDEFLRE